MPPEPLMRPLAPLLLHAEATLAVIASVTKTEKWYRFQLAELIGPSERAVGVRTAPKSLR